MFTQFDKSEQHTFNVDKLFSFLPNEWRIFDFIINSLNRIRYHGIIIVYYLFSEKVTKFHRSQQLILQFDQAHYSSYFVLHTSIYV